MSALVDGVAAVDGVATDVATGVLGAATVPLVGSPLGWMPACVYLALKGTTGPALGLLVYCTVVVSGSDNVIKPLLLRGSARIHPLLGFLSIIGGVLAFGVFGFLIGPVVLSLPEDMLRDSVAVAVVVVECNVARYVIVELRRTRLGGVARTGNGRQPINFDKHRLYGVLGDSLRLGNDDGNGVADEANLVARQCLALRLADR